MFAKSNGMERMLEERRRQVWQRARAGENVTSIAEEFGLSTSRVYADLRRYAKENPRDPEVVKAAREARKARKDRKERKQLARGMRFLRLVRKIEALKAASGFDPKLTAELDRVAQDAVDATAIQRRK